MSPEGDATPENLPCAEITARIWDAVQQVQEADSTLLCLDVHEVTISHRLAMYLEPHFSGWHVDVEYNRLGRRHEADDPNRVKRRDGDPVYPDIIVHERGKPNNLTVIELKLSTNDESREDVKKKLLDFRDEEGLEYRHGVLIEIPAGIDHPDEPDINCITCEKEEAP